MLAILCAMLAFVVSPRGVMGFSLVRSGRRAMTLRAASPGLGTDLTGKVAFIAGVADSTGYGKCRPPKQQLLSSLVVVVVVVEKTKVFVRLVFPGENKSVLLLLFSKNKNESLCFG